MFKLIIKTFGLNTFKNAIRKKVTKKEYNELFVRSPSLRTHP
jgi:hypothetical protein